MHVKSDPDENTDSSSSAVGVDPVGGESKHCLISSVLGGDRGPRKRLRRLEKVPEENGQLSVME